METLTCKLCQKSVDKETYDLFCGMHTKCENESYDCYDHNKEGDGDE